MFAVETNWNVMFVPVCVCVCVESADLRRFAAKPTTNRMR